MFILHLLVDRDMYKRRKDQQSINTTMEKKKSGQKWSELLPKAHIGKSQWQSFSQ